MFLDDRALLMDDPDRSGCEERFVFINLYLRDCASPRRSRRSHGEHRRKGAAYKAGHDRDCLTRSEGLRALDGRR